MDWDGYLWLIGTNYVIIYQTDRDFWNTIDILYDDVMHLSVIVFYVLFYCALPYYLYYYSLSFYYLILN